MKPLPLCCSKRLSPASSSSRKVAAFCKFNKSAPEVFILLTSRWIMIIERVTTNFESSQRLMKTNMAMGLATFRIGMLVSKKSSSTKLLRNVCKPEECHPSNFEFALNESAYELRSRAKPMQSRLNQFIPIHSSLVRSNFIFSTVS